MGGRTRASAVERARIVARLRAKGMTNIEIADVLDVTPTVVGCIVTRGKYYGVEMPRSPYWDRKVSA